MKKLKVGINGFGRIGRLAARIILERDELELVGINSRADVASHAYLLKYDSNYGTLSSKITSSGNSLSVDGKKIAVFNEDLPASIPWRKIDCDIVIDSTGKFRSASDLAGHLKRGAKYVVLSSPAKDETKTYVLGVNESFFNPKEEFIISNSSCTTNCLTTTLKVVNDAFLVNRGFMTTTHAVTDSQNLLDNSHSKETRLRRSAFASMIPAATGSAKDVGKLFPALSGKIICQAIRVPLLTVSLLNLTLEVQKKTNEQDINNAFEIAAVSNLKGILTVADCELVSADYKGSTFSSIVDPFLTKVNGDNLVNIYAWYDNEWGYTTRLVDMVMYVGKKANLV